MTFLRLLPIAALVLCLGFVSCEEDIDFAGDHTETPIIYCVLDQSEDIHYVKITRAFGGTNNSVDVSKIADSSYFQNVQVTVEELKVINNQKTVTQTWVLRDTVLENKAPGAFYGPKQKLYYFNTAGDKLEDGATYRLTAVCNNAEFTVTAETQLVTQVAISTPIKSGAFDFSYDPISKTYKTFSMIVNAGTAEVVNARMEIYFDEYFNGVPVEKKVLWNLTELSGETVGVKTSIPVNGETFYNLINQNLTNDPTITRRKLSKLNVIVTGGSEDLQKYLLVNQPSSTLAQNKPTFTNLKANDGRRVVGIFTARSTVYQLKLAWDPMSPAQDIRAISGKSMENLCEGLITGGKLFCSDNPKDINKTYFCD